jgi:hypothetical protein
MLREFRARITGILLHPSGEFPKARDESLRQVLLYFISLLAVYVLLTLVAGFGYLYLTGNSGSFLHFTSRWQAYFFALTLIGGIAGFLIMMLWLHLWVYLLGGRKGMKQTIKAVLYAQTPAFLLLWIPLPGIARWFLLSLVAIWVIWILMAGIRQLHEVTGTVAFAAVIIPLVVWVIIAYVLLMVPLAQPVAVTSYP